MQTINKVAAVQWTVSRQCLVYLCLIRNQLQHVGCSNHWATGDSVVSKGQVETASGQVGTASRGCVAARCGSSHTVPTTWPLLTKVSTTTCKQLTKFNAPVQWTASGCPVYLCSNKKCGIVFIWLLTPKKKYWIKRKYLLFLNREERIGYLLSSSHSPFLNISWSTWNILQFILVYETQTNIPFKNSSTC